MKKSRRSHRSFFKAGTLAAFGLALACQAETPPLIPAPPTPNKPV